MILDHISNILRYKSLLANDILFDRDVLEQVDPKSGRFEIDGDDFFGICQSYTTKSKEDGLWEAHRKYLDIHYILSGSEIVDVSDISTMQPSNDYTDDYQLFEGNSQLSIVLNRGDFLVLYPNEVHKTGISPDGKNREVEKIVFKQKL